MLCHNLHIAFKNRINITTKFKVELSETAASIHDMLRFDIYWVPLGLKSSMCALHQLINCY